MTILLTALASIGLQFGGIAILCAVTELENWLRERRRKRVEDAR